MGNVKGKDSLYFSTGLDNTGLKKDSDAAVGIIGGMSDKISKINPFAALAVAAIASLALISKAAFDMAQGFETAMKEVQTISAATQEDYAKISKSVFQLSKISTDKPVQLAKAYYQIVSAGYDGAKGLKLLEVASKAAIGGITDTETAADGLTTVLNAFKIEAEESEMVADVLFQTVKLGKTTFSELAANMSTVAPIAAASGISFQEVAAAIATLTKQGVPTAQAMTQIRSAIIGTNEALGDGWVEAMTLQEAFQLLYEKAGGSQTELQKLVGRVEAVGGVLGIAGKNAAVAAEDLDKITKSAGESEKAFATMIKTNEQQWKLFGNNVRATVKDLGDGLLAMSSVLVRSFNKAFEDAGKLERIYKEQRIELFKLKGALNSVNDESEERKELIKKIIKQYPGYLDGIDAEKVSNEKLLTILDQINEAYKDRYKLEKREKELRGAVETEAELEIAFEDSEEKFKETLAELQVIAEDEGIDLIIDFTGSDAEILKQIKTQLENVDGAMETVISTGDKFDKNIQGWATKSIDGLSAQISNQFRLNKQLKEAGVIVTDLTERNDKLNREQWNNAQNQVEAIKLIKKATTSSELLQFNESTVKAIQDALEIRKKTVKEIEAINKIQKEDYKKDPQILAEYLKSENKEIKALAEAREKAFTYKVPGDDGKNAFAKQLSKQKKAYSSYQLALSNEDAKFAKELKKQYNLDFENYEDYLRDKYEASKNTQDKILLLNELKSVGTVLQPRPTVEKIQTTIQPIKLKFELDKESIQTVTIGLQILRDAWFKTTDEVLRASLAKTIKHEEEKLRLLRTGLDAAEDAEWERFNSSRDISRKQLKLDLKNLRDKLKKEEGITEASKKRIAAIEAKIQTSQDALADKFQQRIGDISGMLNEAGSLFRKFGEDDMADLMEQLAGVAEGIGMIAAGITTGNPFAVIQGTLKVLNEAITIEIVSDTAKFEKEIERLSIVLNRLARDVNDAIGLEKIDTRIDALNEEAALLQANERALRAELEARKRVKFLGLTVGTKGKGSGTDPEKVKEFEDAIDELQHKLRNLQLEIYATLTGTTSESITDAIVQGFKDGKTSIEDFADTFEDLMRKAIIESFKLKYIEKIAHEFFEEFGALAEAGQGLTPEEIQQLRTTFAELIKSSQAGMEALNQILADAGIEGGLFGTTDLRNEGLSGAIRREITEETGTELAGLMRRIAEDVRTGVLTGREAVENLVLIQENTFNTVTELQNAVVELRFIADNTKESLLHDLAT